MFIGLSLATMPGRARTDRTGRTCVKECLMNRPVFKVGDLVLIGCNVGSVGDFANEVSGFFR